MRKAFIEVASYVAASLTMISVYFGVNFIQALFSPINADYQSWRILLITAVQSWAQILIYWLSVNSINHLQLRHKISPPILALTLGFAMVLVPWITAGQASQSGMRYLFPAYIVASAFLAGLRNIINHLQK